MYNLVQDGIALPGDSGRLPAVTQHGLGLAVSLSLTLAVVLRYFDQSWSPPDDGAYAYVALRLLEGAVLNLDVQDIHAGYVNLLHAGVLWLLGPDMVNLRYPLAALTVIQSALIYLLLARAGVLTATAGALTMGALTFVQFPNPTANWYALFITVVTVAVLSRSTPGARRDITIGALICCVLLFRQLSGVLVAMGVLTWLLTEEGRGPLTVPWLARSLIAVMGLGLVGYLVGKGSITAWVVFATAPFVALGCAWRMTRMDDRAVLGLLGRLAVGAAIAAAPLIAYHLHHGSLGAWADDVIIDALRPHEFPFIDRFDHAHLPLLALSGLMHAVEPRSLLSGFYWVAIFIAPLAVGVRLGTAFKQGSASAAWGPLPVVAGFYGLVAVHYQIPIYLLYPAALGLVAFLWTLRKSNGTVRVAATLAIALATTGVALHAGQPLSRGMTGVAAGTPGVLDAPNGIPGARIAMEASEADIYRRLIAVVHAHSAPGTTILALPSNPETYVLTGRRPPVRYFSSALGLRDARDMDETMNAIVTAPPALVIHTPDDKYNTPETLDLVAQLTERYRLVERVGRFDVLARRAVVDTD